MSITLTRLWRGETTVENELIHPMQPRCGGIIIKEGIVSLCNEI